MSVSVPASSTRVSTGTLHFRAITSPASAKVAPKLRLPLAMTPRRSARLPTTLRNRITGFGTAPRPAPSAKVGVISTKGRAGSGRGASGSRGMQSAGRSSRSTNRRVLPDRDEK